jgi:hypothetical protein
MRAHRNGLQVAGLVVRVGDRRVGERRLKIQEPALSTQWQPFWGAQVPKIPGGDSHIIYVTASGQDGRGRHYGEFVTDQAQIERQGRGIVYHAPPFGLGWESLSLGDCAGESMGVEGTAQTESAAGYAPWRLSADQLTCVASFGRVMTG